MGGQDKTYISQMFHDEPRRLSFFKLIPFLPDRLFRHKTLGDLRPQPIPPLLPGLIPNRRSDQVSIIRPDESARVVLVRVTIIAAMDAFQLSAPPAFSLEDDVVVVSAAVGRCAPVTDLDAFIASRGGGAGARR